MDNESEQPLSIAECETFIMDTIRDLGGGVSFADLMHRSGRIQGTFCICLPGRENLILWTGLSKEFCDAFGNLKTSLRMHARPTSTLVYMIDGMRPTLPTAKRITKTTPKRDTWIPVCLYEGAYPQGKMPKGGW